MITGMGVDIVRVDRFKTWHTKSAHQLRKVFTPAEIAYCLQTPSKTAQRFAVRFAAREAFFKALKTRLPLLTVCKALEVVVSPTGPILQVSWPALNLEPQITHLSLAHEKDMAIASVILERD